MLNAVSDHLDIHQALERNAFVPYFQPLVFLATGQLAGFEILARLRQTDGRILTPDEFIPQAETDGSIGNITHQILDKAFAAVAPVPGSFALAVNISPVQLRDKSLPQQIYQAAERAPFRLDRLIIEITESAVTDNPEQARAIAQALKDFGCRIALDDFGTGYSSLLHLQSLPFDEIKVDRSFVSSMITRRESRKIVGAIIGLGQSLGLTTIAEGVETEQQAAQLRWLGCDIAQGYLYGRPMPAEDLATFLSQTRPRPPRLLQGSDYAPDELNGLPSQRLAQLKALYDGCPVGLAFVDPQLRFVNLNQQYANLNDMPVEAHIGRYASEVVPNSYYAEVEPYLRRALAGEAILNLEVVRKGVVQKSDRTCLASYQPVRDEAGEIIGVSASVIDITERKHVENALRESEENYRHMVDLNPQIPWIMDANGQALEISPKWALLTGLPLELSFGQGWMEVVHPDDKPRVLALAEQCTGVGIPIDVEYRIRRPEGGWRWVRSRGAPRRDEQGNIIRWYGGLEDIDEYKRAEENLRCSEAHLRAIFNATPLGIILAHAPSGTLRMANAEAYRLFGDPILPDPSAGNFTRWSAFTHDGRKLSADEYPLSRGLRGEAMPQREFLCRFADGQTRLIAMAGAPIHAADGSLIGALVITQDMNASHQRLNELVKNVLEGLRMNA